MPLSLTLDAVLFQMIGGQLKRFAEARKDLLVAVNEMVSLFTSRAWFSTYFWSIILLHLDNFCISRYIKKFITEETMH